MKKLNLLFMALFITLFVVSCSDSGSDPDDTDDDGNLKLTTGSYWIMESYDFKEDGTKDESTLTTDSSYVGMAALVDNFSYLPYITMYEEADEYGTMMTISDTMFCKINKRQLYAIMQFGGEDFFGMSEFNIPVLLADWDATASWAAITIDTTVKAEVEEMGLVDVDVNMTVKITPGGMSKYTLAGKSMDVKEFAMEMKMDVNMSNIVQTSSKSTSHYFISKDNFIMQILEDETVSKTTYMGQTMDETYPGSVSKVIRYHIK